MARRGKKKLPDRRARFVREYVKDLNATQAAIRAGYAAKSAAAEGHRLLRFADVHAEVERILDRAAEEAELSVAQVMADIKRLAAKAERAGDLGPAMRGRELLGKHLKAFTEKRELDVGPSLEQLILASMKPEES